MVLARRRTSFRNDSFLKSSRTSSETEVWEAAWEEADSLRVVGIIVVAMVTTVQNHSRMSVTNDV